MVKVQLHSTDARLLELIEILKANGIIRFRQEFCDALGIKKQNIRNVQVGNTRFTVEHMETVFEVYNVNPLWVFGYSDQVFRSKRKLYTMMAEKAALKK